MWMMFIFIFLIGALSVCTILLGLNLIMDFIQRKKDEKLLFKRRLESLEEKIYKIENKNKRGK